MPDLTPIFPAVASQLVSNGWQVVWCTLNSDQEWSPLVGTTGGSAAFPSNRPMPAGEPVRIAFRPPPHVVIFDVDHYAHKLGWHTIERMEEHVDATLPPTWKVTSRGAGDPSGRYLFKIPAGTDTSSWERALRYFGKPDTRGIKTAQFSDVEVVRTGHRFSWAPFDTNPKNGELVQCYDPSGKSVPLPPVDSLPSLPDEWLAFFQDAPQPQVSVSVPEADMNRPQWWLQVPAASIGTRDELCAHAFNLLLSGLDRDEAITELRRVALALDTASPWRDCDFRGMTDANSQGKASLIRSQWAAEREYVEALGVDIAAERLRAQQAYEFNQRLTEGGDRVELAIEYGLTTADESTREAVLVGIIRDEQGVALPNFDPPAFSDQELAEAVLDRLQGARYCTDSKVWLVWKSETAPWEEEDDILPWVISKLAQAMPFGDAAPGDDDEDGPAQKLRFRSRQYLLSDRGSRAVARKAASFLAVSGTHRVSYRRSWVDADPDVIWADGRCYDIRKSLERPVEAEVSLTDTPHLMTCEVRPRDIPVPGFLALTEAVLPDPATREFWLDMMALGITGYASKRTIALGTGETKTGKTLLLSRLPFGSYLEQVSGMDLLSGGDREEARRLNILVGRRLPYIDEGIPKGHYATGRLKKISNGVGALPARGIYGREYTFRPTHTLVILCNAEEEPSYQDDAVKDRVCRVPFGLTDPKTPEERARQAAHVARVAAVSSWYDPDKQQWKDETPGVLWFFIRRAAQILGEGSMRGTSFVKPLSLVADQDDVAAQENPVQDWMTRCTQPLPEDDRSEWTDSSTLHDHFLTWGKDRPGVKFMSKIDFGRRLTKLGVDSYRPGGYTRYAVKVQQAWASLSR